MSLLADEKCAPCKKGTPPLTPQEVLPLLKQLDGWEVVENHHLARTKTFPDFVTALNWVNKVAEIAEQQQHHPDIHLSWGKVQVEIWTHSIGGLSKGDFILAAKIDRI